MIRFQWLLKKSFGLCALSWLLALSLATPPLAVAQEAAGTVVEAAGFAPANGKDKAPAIKIQDVVDTQKEDSITLYPGDLVTLKVYGLTRVAVSNPEVADVASADVDEVLIVGNGPGETPVFVWDQYGKRMILARVTGESLEVLAARIAKLLEDAGIYGVEAKPNTYEGKVILTGRLIRDQQPVYNMVIERFADSTISMVREYRDLIQIDAQVSELNTTLSKEIGFDWTAGDTDDFVGLQFQETLPTTNGSFDELFKLGDFNRTSALLATVNMLIEDGKARILSKPSIVVANGEEASILVGGEIPVRTTTTSTGGTSVQEDVRFKEYGIDLTVTPEIRGDKIDLVMSVSIREIDNTNAVGEDVAFTLRSAQSRLTLENGQTIVIAGLIKHQESELVKRVPFLSAIPIVGMLFRNVRTPSANQEQEIVISLTPRIVRQAKSNMSSLASRSVVPDYEEDPWVEEILKERPTLKDAGMYPDAAELEDADPMEIEGASKADPAMTVPGDEEWSDYDDPATSGMTPALEEYDDFDGWDDNGETLDPMMEEDPWLGDKVWNDDPAPEYDTDSPAAPAYPAPALVKNSAPDSIDPRVKRAIQSYAQEIQAQISQAVSFPYEAREQGWEGTVMLSLQVLSNGELNAVDISKSSGHKIFDNDAVKTARVLSPYQPFPSDLTLEEIVLKVPIVYSRLAMLEDFPAPDVR